MKVVDKRMKKDLKIQKARAKKNKKHGGGGRKRSDSKLLNSFLIN